MRFAICLLVILAGAPASAQHTPEYETLDTEHTGSFAERIIPIPSGVPAPSGKWMRADGSNEGFADYAGQVVVTTIWATWCHVCLEEMPAINALAAEFASQDIAFRPLSVDTVYPVKRVQAYLDDAGLSNLPVLIDMNHIVANRIGVRGTPTTIFVDKFGQVTAAIEGSVAWDDPAMRAYLEALMAAPDAQMSRNILGS